MTEIRILEASKREDMEKLLNETEGEPVGELIVAGNSATGFRFFHKVEFSLFENAAG